MKRAFYLFNAAIGLILILGIAGCASSPEVEEQPVEEQSIEEQQTEVLQEEPVESPAAALLSQIEEARRAAEEAGAREYYPEQFATADFAAQRAQDLFNAEDTDAALAEGRKALAWYRMLKIGMDIRDLRQKILEYSFDVEDPEGFADAEAKYGEAVEKFELEHEEAERLSMQALAAYQTVCNNGFMRIAEEERARALEIIELCDSIKAARSMASDYQAASETFASAERLGEQGLWEESCKGYRDASILFAEVYQNALYKRNVANEAMNAARARQEASTALALEADEIAPLPDEEEEAAANAEEAVAAPEVEPAAEEDAAAFYESESAIISGEEITIDSETAPEESAALETGIESGEEHSIEDQEATE